MIEVINKVYTQRFFATKLPIDDLFKAVTYTQYEGKNKVPWYYKQVKGETSTLDLTRTLDEIFAKMKSNTRNEIKRAIKEGIEFETNYCYDAFVPFYNKFCNSKNLDGKIEVQTLAKYDKTIITVAKYGGVVLAMHATVVNERDKEAMLLYSCSQRLNDNVDRKMIGWGNRYLHYKEFEFFKELGLKRYEWNGVCTNPSNPDVYNISLFKLAFGSEAKMSLGLRTPLFLLLKYIQHILNKVKILSDFIIILICIFSTMGVDMTMTYYTNTETTIQHFKNTRITSQFVTLGPTKML